MQNGGVKCEASFWRLQHLFQAVAIPIPPALHTKSGRNNLPLTRSQLGCHLLIKLTMLTPIDEAYARLSMLEFALEVVMANHLSKCNQELSNKFKDDFVRKMHPPDLSSPALSGPFSPEREQKEAEIIQRTIEMAERFMQKVAKHEAEIRAQVPRP
jgi:hypothetical protein